MRARVEQLLRLEFPELSEQEVTGAVDQAVAGEEIQVAIAGICFRVLRIALEHAGVLPRRCSRCGTKPATDGEHCAGCHDFLGELQDERGAS